MVAQRGGQVSPILGGLHSRTFRSRGTRRWGALSYCEVSKAARGTRLWRMMARRVPIASSGWSARALW